MGLVVLVIKWINNVANTEKNNDLNNKQELFGHSNDLFIAITVKIRYWGTHDHCTNSIWIL